MYGEVPYAPLPEGEFGNPVFNCRKACLRDDTEDGLNIGNVDSNMIDGSGHACARAFPDFDDQILSFSFRNATRLAPFCVW